MHAHQQAIKGLRPHNQRARFHPEGIHSHPGKRDFPVDINRVGSRYVISLAAFLSQNGAYGPRTPLLKNLPPFVELRHNTNTVLREVHKTNLPEPTVG